MLDNNSMTNKLCVCERLTILILCHE
uniref:Uncharacterized protein n=1 Tax=Rhizophora mucronata TaxID=61149 RepID=A0A2P2NGB3_RHIMU